ncbi:hypothetical protein CWT12_12370 [Actinomyces sp. 432]|uniref:hypothetical protein n=1 Tax=Actinomyces sp. 432 TaxID=2057798 RepID=UPI0013744F56|nr:hypothetical protein [Actinomyces sp. 432]QHO91946.1 hypothetical protein CWT12_12370 [Actinomyces sp. 432]
MLDVDAPAPKPKASTAHGTRLPEDWQPPPDLVAWTRAECPAAATDREVEKFRDYWLSTPGARGRKASWTRTWKTWARRCQDDADARQQRQQGYRNQAQVLADMRAQADQITRQQQAANPQGDALRLIAGGQA